MPVFVYHMNMAKGTSYRGSFPLRLASEWGGKKDSLLPLKRDILRSINDSGLILEYRKQGNI